MRDLRPILLVEDNPKDAELTMAALARCQLLNDVTHVRDGVEALEYLRCQGRYEGAMHGGPVVVLLDLKLPKLNGLEVLKEIRSDRALSSTPVVMLTSSREEQDLIRSEAAGGAKKLYTITPEGQAFLTDNKVSVDAVMARMDLAASAFASHSTPEMVREAYRTLKHALHMRRGPWTVAEAERVRSVIEKAARDILGSGDPL